MSSLLDPMSDVVFKAMFGRENPLSNKLLLSLLNSIFLHYGEEQISSLTILNPIHTKQFPSEKQSVLDIKATTDRDERVHIEVQVRREHAYRKRSLFYWAKTYAETIGESDPYQEIKRTIMINIMGYDALFETQRFHSRFQVLEKDELFPLTTDLDIHFLELPKLPKIENVDTATELEAWLFFLKNGAKDEQQHQLQQLAERRNIMEDARELLEAMSSDQALREAYLSREKALLDEKSRYHFALREAEAEGEEKKTREVITSMLRANMDIALIEQIVKVPREEVLKIQETLDS